MGEEYIPILDNAYVSYIHDNHELHDFLIELTEQQQILVETVSTLLGYVELFTYIIVPLTFIIICLWWFFRQFLGTY